MIKIIMTSQGPRLVQCEVDQTLHKPTLFLKGDMQMKQRMQIH